MAEGLFDSYDDESRAHLPTLVKTAVSTCANVEILTRLSRTSS